MKISQVISIDMLLLSHFSLVHEYFIVIRFLVYQVCIYQIWSDRQLSDVNLILISSITLAILLASVLLPMPEGCTQGFILYPSLALHPCVGWCNRLTWLELLFMLAFWSTCLFLTCVQSYIAFWMSCHKFEMAKTELLMIYLSFLCLHQRWFPLSIRECLTLYSPSST